MFAPCVILGLCWKDVFRLSVGRAVLKDVFRLCRKGGAQGCVPLKRRKGNVKDVFQLSVGRAVLKNVFWLSVRRAVLKAVFR